jgi:PPOX class probable F420-dependent enzyme
VVPIVYARVGERIYFVVDDKPKRTHTRLKRLRNIEENESVAVIIDDYERDWNRLAYLLIRGRAQVVVDRREYAHALAALRQRYAQYGAMQLEIETHPMVRITPGRCHFWRADEPMRSPGRDV